MHKLISIDEAVMTRNIELENIDTGTIDKCFDDSALISYNNFDFMKIGSTYDCKIWLFGIQVNEKDKDTLECKVVNKDVQIGKTLFVEVLVEKDIYYVYQKDIDSLLYQNKFLFSCSKRIIQVDYMIYDDMLHDD